MLLHTLLYTQSHAQMDPGWCPLAQPLPMGTSSAPQPKPTAPVARRSKLARTHPRRGWTTRPWGLSSPWMTAFLKEPSSRATLICFLLVS